MRACMPDKAFCRADLFLLLEINSKSRRVGDARGQFGEALQDAAAPHMAHDAPSSCLYVCITRYQAMLVAFTKKSTVLGSQVIEKGR